MLPLGVRGLFLFPEIIKHGNWRLALVLSAQIPAFDG